MPFSRKKLLSLLLLFTTHVQGAMSEETAEGTDSKHSNVTSGENSLESKPMIEAKAGYFFFASSTMRQVYDEGGWDVQLSSSIPVWNPVKRLSLNVYGSVEFLRCSGKSKGGDAKTYLWELPVNIGLKPVFLLSQQVQYYFSLGPRYFFIRQRNFSHYVDKHKSRNGVGFFVNTGFNFILNQHLVIDLFGEYSYAKTHFHSSTANVYTREMQVGGFTFGGSLGYCF